MSNELFGGVEVVDGQERQEFVLGRGTPFETKMEWPQAGLPLQQHYAEVNLLLLGLRKKFITSGMQANAAIIDGIRGLFCLAAVDIEKLEKHNAALEKRIDALEKACLRTAPGYDAATKFLESGSHTVLPAAQFVDTTADDEDPA